MTGMRMSIHKLSPKMQEQAMRKLAAAGKLREHVCQDDEKPKAPKIPKLSAPEERLAFHLKAEGINDFVRQFRWHPERMYRSDFAWVEKRLLVEVQGGIYTNGAHVRGKGYEKDRARSNEAVILGYRILEFTPHQIKGGYAVRTIIKALEAH